MNWKNASRMDHKSNNWDLSSKNFFREGTHPLYKLQWWGGDTDPHLTPPSAPCKLPFPFSNPGCATAPDRRALGSPIVSVHPFSKVSVSTNAVLRTAVTLASFRGFHFHCSECSLTQSHFTRRVTSFSVLTVSGNGPSTHSTISLWRNRVTCCCWKMFSQFSFTVALVSRCNRIRHHRWAAVLTLG